MVLSLSLVSTILPVASFLFIFILVYAILIKTKVLGDNNFVSLFISLIISSFFIVNVNLVNLVNVSTSWVVLLFVIMFFIMVILAFVGKEASDAFTKHKSIMGIIVVLVIVIFVIVSSYTFNWAFNWDLLRTWFDKDWFGMIVLIVLAAIVSFVLTKTPVVKK